LENLGEEPSYESKTLYHPLPPLEMDLDFETQSESLSFQIVKYIIRPANMGHGIFEGGTKGDLGHFEEKTSKVGQRRRK